MTLTIERLKQVDIPWNVSNKPNNWSTALGGVGVYNNSINFYKGVKLIIEELVGTSGTDLNVSQGATSVSITSSTGLDTSILNATSSRAGVMALTDKVNLDNLVTLSGVSSSNLGTFTGSIISDNSSIKNALQQLEAAVGSGGASTNLGLAQGASTVAITSDTGTDITIPSATTSLAGVMSASDKSNLNSIIALSGMTGDSTGLGSFTGTTIADGSNIKAALQSLETGLESIDTTLNYQLVTGATHTLGASNLLYARADDSAITVNITTAMTALSPYYLLIRPSSSNSVSVSFTGVSAWLTSPSSATETSSSTITYSTADSNIAVMLIRFGTVIFYFNLTP